MATFRFRAQAALDLRRRQFDAAQRELADAERVRDQARVRADEATAAVAAARAAGSARAHQAGTITDWHWYRFWILRLEHERVHEHAVLASKEALVEASRLACAAARQRCESLERFREKALKAFVEAEASAERKLIDELATRRFVLGSRGFQGVSS
jgi:flagellar export protein FliJ